jgi:hypothetical protein
MSIKYLFFMQMSLISETLMNIFQEILCSRVDFL